MLVRIGYTVRCAAVGWFSFIFGVNWVGQRHSVQL